MKKKIDKLFLIFGCIAIICGLFALFIHKAGIFTELGFSESLSLLFGILGGIVFLSGCGLIYYDLVFVKKWGKTAQIEEKDERNIAVRGKAAEFGQSVASAVNLVLTILFLVLDLDTAAYIMAGATMVQTFAFVLAIGYYNEKM